MAYKNVVVFANKLSLIGTGCLTRLDNTTFKYKVLLFMNLNLMTWRFFNQIELRALSIV